MEFFLPSLIAFIIAIAIVFVVLPRLAAPVLVIVSLTILAFAIYQHVTLFKTEYALSTWQEQLKFYAPFVMIAGLLIAVLTYFGVLASTGSSLPVPTLPNTPNLPAANTATNTLTAAINNGIRAGQNIIPNMPKNIMPNMPKNVLPNIIPNMPKNVFGTNQQYGVRNNTKNNRSYFSPI